jgi:hypothetical protein
MKETVKLIRENWGEGKAEREYWEALDGKIGAFPCRSFNLGQQTATVKHKDHKNMAQGWCSVTPVGEFNPDMGGHFVLWDYKMVIRFPAGSTVLIPSALLSHSNTPVQPSETRYSIVQYAAGGLSRWVQNGFMTDKDRLASEEGRTSYEGEKRSRWISAINMYTRLDELQV